jgi:hypothetical protein
LLRIRSSFWPGDDNALQVAPCTLDGCSQSRQTREITLADTTNSYLPPPCFDSSIKTCNLSGRRLRWLLTAVWQFDAAAFGHCAFRGSGTAPGFCCRTRPANKMSPDSGPRERQHHPHPTSQRTPTPIPKLQIDRIGFVFGRSLCTASGRFPAWRVA